MLLIVDPQLDFINGTLKVNGAEEAMNRLAYHIQKTDGDYACKVITTDWHPYNHCSFKDFGGEWPMHCVQNSSGAAIWFPILKETEITKGNTFILRKGDDKNKDEYSIFQNETSSRKLKFIVNDLGIGNIEICGLAGDICVLNTLKDGIDCFGKNMFTVLKSFSPSLDGGNKLSTFISNNQLNVKME